MKNIFKFQVWHQNAELQILFQQVFVVCKTFLVGIKTKNLPRMTRFGLWLFYKSVL